MIPTAQSPLICPCKIFIQEGKKSQEPAQQEISAEIDSHAEKDNRTRADKVISFMSYMYIHAW